MVAPAFGFSVGDFIAAIDALTKVAKALRETSGASAQHRQAIADLDQILSVLKAVQSLDDTTVSQHILDKVQLCSHACHIPLAAFLRKLEKFEVVSSVHRPNRTGLNTLIRSSRKAQWALLVEEELAKLKASLAPQLATIEILLQLSNAEHVASINKATVKTQDDLVDIMSKVDSMKSSLTQHTATKDGLDSLHSLVQSFGAQQSQTDVALMSAANVTQATTQEVLVKVNAQEAAVNVLLQRINAQPTFCAPTPPDPTSLNLTPRATTSLQPFPHSDESGDSAHTAALTARLLLAARKGIGELLLMLLCLLPAITKFFRSLMAICDSPTLLLESNINLEDALGRVLSLPFEHFRYWPVLEARLKEAFIGLPGEDKILLNQFHIINLQHGGNAVLTRKAWSKAVKPGSRLAMSMLYQGTGSGGEACPRCSLGSAIGDADTWIVCRGCKLTYRVLETEAGPKTSKSGVGRSFWYEDIMDGVEFIDPTVLGDTGEHHARERDMDHFKRIHVIDGVTTDQEHRGSEAKDEAARDSTQSEDDIKLVEDAADSTIGEPGSYGADGDRSEIFYDRYYGTPVTGLSSDDSDDEPVRKWHERRGSGYWSSRASPVDSEGSNQDEMFPALERASSDDSTTAQPSTDVSTAPWPSNQSFAKRGPTNMAKIINDSESERRENRVRIVDPRVENDDRKPKGILKKPTSRFPEDPNTVREGVAPLKDVLSPLPASFSAPDVLTNNVQATAAKEVPPGARWTRIDRRLVNPEALKEAHERFEERWDCVIVLRVLTKQEIQSLADRTWEIREERDRLEAGDSESVQSQ